MELTNQTTFQNTQVNAKVKPGRRRLPPSRKRAAYINMFFGIVYPIAFVLYNSKYNYQVALRPEFMKHTLLMWYVFLVSMCQGCKWSILFLGFCYSGLEDRLNE